MVSVKLCLLGLLAICQYGESQVTFADVALSTAAAEQDVTALTDLTGLTVTATATSPQVIASYAITTNPGSIFAVSGTTVGQLRLAANKGLDYEFQSVFVLVMTATDDTTGTALVGTASVTVSVSDVTTDATFSTLYTCAVLADMAAVGTTVATLTASGTGTTYAINPTTNFDISSTGVVTVKTGVTIDRSTTPNHALTVTAILSSLTSSTVLNVCVGSSTQCSACACSGAAAVTFNLVTFFSLLLMLVL